MRSTCQRVKLNSRLMFHTEHLSPGAEFLSTQRQPQCPPFVEAHALQRPTVWMH